MNIVRCLTDGPPGSSISRHNFPEDGPKLVNLMLKYFYTRDYEDEWSKRWGSGHDLDPKNTGPIFENMGLYALAAKYDVHTM